MKKATSCLWGLLLLLPVALCGQTGLISHAYRQALSHRKANLDSALHYFELMQRYALEQQQYDSLFLALRWKAQCATDHNRFTRLRQYLEEDEHALAKFGDQLTPSLLTKETISLKSFWAGYYLRIGSYPDAVRLNRQVIDLLQGKPERSTRDSFLIFRSYSFIAQTQKNSGDYQAAIQNYWESLGYIRNHTVQIAMGADGLIISQVAECYRQLDGLAQARRYYERSIRDLESRYPASNEEYQLRLNKNLLTAYHNYARYFLQISRADSAVYWLERSLQLDDNPLFRTSYNLLGEAYIAQGDHPRAMQALGAALRLEEQLAQGHHYAEGVTLTLMGRSFAQQGNWEEALAYYDQARETFGGNPTDGELSGAIGGHELLKTLSHQAEAQYQYYRQQALPKRAAAAMATVRQALQLMDELRNGLHDDWDKQLMLDRRYRLYELAFSLSFEQDQDDHAALFALAEQSKASVLLDAVREARRKAIADIPLGILEEERNLEAQQLAIKQQLSALDNPSDSILVLRQRFAQLQQRRQQLSEQIAPYVQDPAADQEQPLLTLAATQAMLTEDQAVVDYFLGDSTLFIFLLTDKSSQVWRKPVPTSLATDIRRLRSEISSTGRRQAANAASVFAEVSGRLYRLLLETPLEALPDGVGELIIIPDGVLGYLPFEILVPPGEVVLPFSKLPFLLHQYAVSYAYSAALLSEQRAIRPRVIDWQFAGFASEYPSGEGAIATAAGLADWAMLQPLEGARAEVLAAAELFGRNAVTHTSAGENDFRQEAPRSRIVLLAMHALLDNRRPMFSCLLFTPTAATDQHDNVLYTDEIYSLHLNAELIILSACNSGYGPLHRGEGIMSLSRAFTSAGAASTVMSLWKAPDGATAQIMETFLTYLKAGRQKHEALRLAKLDYLRGQPGTLSAHPYFWAGFVAAGDMEAMYFSNEMNLIYWFLPLVLLLAAVGFTCRKFGR